MYTLKICAYNELCCSPRLAFTTGAALYRHDAYGVIAWCSNDDRPHWGWRAPQLNRWCAQFAEKMELPAQSATTHTVHKMWYLNFEFEFLNLNFSGKFCHPRIQKHYHLHNNCPEASAVKTSVNEVVILLAFWSFRSILAAKDEDMDPHTGRRRQSWSDSGHRQCHCHARIPGMLFGMACDGMLCRMRSSWLP